MRCRNHAYQIVDIDVVAVVVDTFVDTTVVLYAVVAVSVVAVAVAVAGVVVVAVGGGDVQQLVVE